MVADGTRRDPGAGLLRFIERGRGCARFAAALQNGVFVLVLSYSSRQLVVLDGDRRRDAVQASPRPPPPSGARVPRSSAGDVIGFEIAAPTRRTTILSLLMTKYSASRCSLPWRQVMRHRRNRGAARQGIDRRGGQQVSSRIWRCARRISRKGSKCVGTLNALLAASSAIIASETHSPDAWAPSRAPLQELRQDLPVNPDGLRLLRGELPPPASSPNALTWRSKTRRSWPVIFSLPTRASTSAANTSAMPRSQSSSQGER